MIGAHVNNYSHQIFEDKLRQILTLAAYLNKKRLTLYTNAAM